MSRMPILAILLITISLVFTACSYTTPPITLTPETQAPTQQEPTSKTTGLETEPVPIDPVTGLPLSLFPDLAGVRTGAIKGRVLFYDGTPAFPCIVYVFHPYQNKTSHYTYTNEKGYYTFDGVLPSPAGARQEGSYMVKYVEYYEVYPISDVSSVKVEYSLTAVPLLEPVYVDEYKPHERVQVYEHEAAVVPTIEVGKPYNRD